MASRHTVPAKMEVIGAQDSVRDQQAEEWVSVFRITALDHARIGNADRRGSVGGGDLGDKGRQRVRITDIHRPIVGRGGAVGPQPWRCLLPNRPARQVAQRQHCTLAGKLPRERTSNVAASTGDQDDEGRPIHIPGHVGPSDRKHKKARREHIGDEGSAVIPQTSFHLNAGIRTSFHPDAPLGPEARTKTTRSGRRYSRRRSAGR